MFSTTHLVGFGAGGSIVPATISNTASGADVSNATAYTFSSQALGAAASDRKIVVGVVEVAATTTVSTLTVGGVSASLVKRQSGGIQVVELWQADVPTGTTGDVVVTMAAASQGVAIGVWRVVGAASAASNTLGAYAAPATGTIDIPAGGVLVAMVGNRVVGTTTVTWTGPTEDFDANDITSAGNDTYSGASGAHATAQTGYTVTATMSGAGADDPVMAAASWGPA